jgi:hypothetical protein
VPKKYDIADPNDPDTLVVPFMFVPHGCEPTPEWLREHPGAIRIAAVMVPRDPQPGETGPQWSVQLDPPRGPAAASDRAGAGGTDGFRSGDQDARGPDRPQWPPTASEPRASVDAADRKVATEFREPGEAPGPAQSHDIERDAIAAWRAAEAVSADPGRFAGIVRTAADPQGRAADSIYGTPIQAQAVKSEEENHDLVKKLVYRADDYAGGSNSATRVVDSRTISGGASYYDLPGHSMANGQPFDSNAMNAAMLGVPLGTVVTVALAGNPSHSITVRITDRGPYVTGRVIDLSPAAFVALVGSLDVGVARVVVTIP